MCFKWSLFFKRKIWCILFFHLSWLLFLFFNLRILVNSGDIRFFFLFDFVSKVESFWNESRLFLFTCLCLKLYLFVNFFILLHNWFLSWNIHISILIFFIEPHKFWPQSWFLLLSRLFCLLNCLLNFRLFLYFYLWALLNGFFFILTVFLQIKWFLFLLLDCLLTLGFFLLLFL